MNEIKDETIKCNHCLHKKTITICRACKIYNNGSNNFIDLFDDEDTKAENLQIRDDQFFSIAEFNENIVFLIKNNYVDGAIIQIPLTLSQVNIIQKHLYKILKNFRDKEKKGAKNVL